MKKVSEQTMKDEEKSVWYSDFGEEESELTETPAPPAVSIM